MNLDTKKKIKNDVILIIALVITVSAFGAAYFFLREEGRTVCVKVDGVVYGEYSLVVDMAYEIISENGHNLLVTESGSARVESASCPDGICSSHRPVSRVGESIVCLPNKVSITVKGAPDEVDIIA